MVVFQLLEEALLQGLLDHRVSFFVVLVPCDLTSIDPASDSRFPPTDTRGENRRGPGIDR